MGILKSYVQVFRQAKPYSLYVLMLFLVIYMFNQLDRYTLSITNLEIAQSLKFGDRACMKLPNATIEQGSICSNLTEAMYETKKYKPNEKEKIKSSSLLLFVLNKNKKKPSCNTITVNTTNGTWLQVCKYDYNGQGIEYQIVAGPAFILIFTFTGIFLSIFADRFQNRRVIILTGCLAWWSLMTVLTGFVNSYWQLLLLRIGLGIGLDFFIFIFLFILI